MKFQESSVLRNFTYLFINQFSNLIIPFLVFPYLIKTLGLEYFGLYSLTYACMLFCFMFSDYGFNFSGSKYVTLNRSELPKLNNVFSTILSIKILIAILISILWFLFVLYSPLFSEHLFFGFLFIGMILGNAINLQWFFQGLEKLGWFSTVNSIIKLVSNISILFFVKTPHDIYLLPLIYSFAYLLTGLITILIATYVAQVNIKLFRFLNARRFLKEGFDYFITISSTSLVFNGTIIILSFFESNILIIGAFSALDRILKILVSIYVPYSSAIYPKNMANFHISPEHGMRSVIKYGKFALLCASSIILVIWFFSDTILYFLDPELVKFSLWLKVLSLWFIFIIINNLFGYHFMNGLNKSAEFRNINILYTCTTVLFMVIGCYFYSFKGCILAVISGEILLTCMLAYNTRSQLFKMHVRSIN